MPIQDPTCSYIQNLNQRLQKQPHLKIMYTGKKYTIQLTPQVEEKYLLRTLVINRHNLNKNNLILLDQRLEDIREEETLTLASGMTHQTKLNLIMQKNKERKQKARNGHPTMQRPVIQQKDLLQLHQQQQKLNKEEIENNKLKNLNALQKLMLNTSAEQKKWNKGKDQQPDESDYYVPEKMQQEFKKIDYVDKRNILKYNNEDEFQIFSIQVGIKNNNFALQQLENKLEQLETNMENHIQELLRREFTLDELRQDAKNLLGSQFLLDFKF